MPSMEKDEIRQALAQEAARLAAMREDVRTADELNVDEVFQSGGEISSADQHPADTGSTTQQREIDLSLLEQVEAELADVERALAKLSQGTYGTCDVCGESIDQARLVELPATALCIAHAQARQTEGIMARQA